MTSPVKPRLLTGDRPTGRLHLGHYVGSLANRVRLQNQYDSFFIIADLHTLTTRPEREYIKEIPAYIRDIVLDYLINELYTNFRYFSFGVSTEKNGRFLNEGLIHQKEMFGARSVVHDFYEVDLT